MYALIAWKTNNGIALTQEQLEVVASNKFIIMNGGKLEADSEVNMLFKKEMWGGVIHSIHGNVYDILVYFSPIAILRLYDIPFYYLITII